MSSPAATVRFASSLSNWRGHAFGWVGAADKHLAKYTAMLDRVGVGVTTRETIPAQDSFFFHHRLRGHAERWLNEANTVYPDQPIASILLSNGGCFVWREIQRALNEDLQLPSEKRRWPRVVIGAVIFDSAPVAGTPEAFAKAFSTANAASPFLRKVVYLVSVSLARVFFSVSYLGQYHTHRFTSLFDALAREPCAAPQFFIYSEADEVTDYRFLADHIKERRRFHARGAEAVTEWFISGRESPHCCHLAAAPEEYFERVKAFLLEAAKEHRAI